MKKIMFSMLAMAFAFGTYAQQTPPTEYGSGLKVSLSEDGNKYFRLIAWTQFWLTDQLGDDQFAVTPSLRRSRMLVYAQLTDRFLILTHFGLNNLNPDGLHPTGQSSQAQLFMHDAWVEYKVFNELYLGGGLHYWNGISRLNNQSTLNMLPLDNPRHAWATIGTSDQFARHLGIYAKGKLGKLDYRLAWNSAMTNSIDANLPLMVDKATYNGRRILGTDAASIVSGYFNYQFFDQESNKLPYFVGTYFGKKKVFNVGAGFLSHGKGSLMLNTSGDTITQNVLLFAVDAFAEIPFGNNGALTGYASFQSNDYGMNYQLGGGSTAVFSGNVIYFQGGVLLPHSGKDAWQPYVTATQRSIDAVDDSATDFGVGINYLLSGHNAKLSLELRNTGAIVGDASQSLLFQAVVFL